MPSPRRHNVSMAVRSDRVEGVDPRTHGKLVKDQDRKVKVTGKVSVTGRIDGHSKLGEPDQPFGVLRDLEMVADMAASLMERLQLDLTSVEAGVPTKALTDLVSASGLEFSAVYNIVIPARTLKHRRSRNQALSTDESDKLVRLVRVFDQAVSVLGTAEKARHWLNAPKKRFDGRTPLQMLRTDLGGRQVEELLGQIDEGMFA